MTRNFNALSLNAPWNCVTIRLQNPNRQFAGGPSDGGAEPAAGSVSAASTGDVVGFSGMVLPAGSLWGEGFSGASVLQAILAFSPQGKDAGETPPPPTHARPEKY